MPVLTCTTDSSPRAEQHKVGVVPINPESDTSSTVSPMLNTRVALLNDTTMYASNSSVTWNQKNTNIVELNS